MDAATEAGSLVAILLPMAAVLALLALSGFFSGSETALTAINRGAMHQYANRGSRGAEAALRLTEDKERLIGSILLGNNLVNVLATALTTAAFTAALGEAGVAYATLLMTALVTVFAEVAPKTYAITRPDQASIRVAPIIAFFVRILSPFVQAIRFFVRGAFRLLGIEIDADAHVLAPHEEIAGAIALHHFEGSVEKADRDRLLGALDLGQRQVEEVMLHRSEIEMIDADAAPSEILRQAINSPHTRIPIFREDPENIIGVIHAKDLSRTLHELVEQAGENPTDLSDFNVMDLAMQPYFVPETTPLDEQMREFLRRHSHFALVVDEYGALRGLVTLEDIIEEIVGEIADEHDTVTAAGIEPQADGSVIVEGSVTIRDLNRDCDWNLPDDEANTIAGLVIHEAQAIPTEGQVFSFHGFRFEVVERQNNRLSRLRLRKLVA